MTRDEQAVVALLRSLYDWIPGPKIASMSGAVPGEVASDSRPCPSCGGEGERRVRGMLQSCDRCGGRGALVVDQHTRREIAEAPSLAESIRSELALEDESSAPESGLAATARAVRKRRQDKIAALLEVEDAGPSDPVARMLSRFETQYDAGDYAALECRLAILRRVDRSVFAAVQLVYVLDQVLERKTGPRSWREIQPVRRGQAQRGVGWLAVRMPKPVRVPPWLGRVEPNDEAAKASLWWGRSDRHEAERERRNADIRALAAVGMPAVEISDRTSVSVRRVEQICASSMLVEVAS